MSDSDGPPRTTVALIGRVEEIQNRLVNSFETIIRRTANAPTDRNTTAVNEYQAQIDTATMIKSAEDLQTLIRQLQEMWLFGHLNTMGESQTQQRTDENAKAVAGLLQQLIERQGATQDGQEMEGVIANGTSS